MKLIVFFDLPTQTKKERKAYTVFRNKLLENGFFMLQYSVYCRTYKGEQSSNKFVEYIKKIAPKNGNVRLLKITDKQYSSIEVIIGEQKNEEKITQGTLFEV